MRSYIHTSNAKSSQLTKCDIVYNTFWCYDNEFLLLVNCELLHIISYTSYFMGIYDVKYKEILCCIQTFTLKGSHVLIFNYEFELLTGYKLIS